MRGCFSPSFTRRFCNTSRWKRSASSSFPCSFERACQVVQDGQRLQMVAAELVLALLPVLSPPRFRLLIFFPGCRGCVPGNLGFFVSVCDLRRASSGFSARHHGSRVRPRQLFPENSGRWPSSSRRSRSVRGPCRTCLGAFPGLVCEAPRLQNAFPVR